MPAALAVGSATLFAWGCGPGNFANTNDRLRRENLELQQSVDELSRRLEREVQAQEVLLARASGAAGSLPEGARPPVLVGVTMDRYGAAVDENGDGLDDLVRLYVYPRDQQDRMLPSAGTLTARVLDLSTPEPTVLGRTELDPAAFDAAYRDGFTGPYYRVEVPLTALAGRPAGQRPREVTAIVSLAPAVGGPALTAQRVFELDRE
ncbi:hypothetical protein [Phycisphaera mikurensis]|uniref:hypothetical protein n=1 Tax=Phycisphaera mikurensis TaxID=547188 RepID=UPI00059D283B|nr:hypothetical protein [Phycisphaera mikurensis]MBB6442431.1 hypothetical protein [Phycisphaera mikurensis]